MIISFFVLVVNFSDLVGAVDGETDSCNSEGTGALICTKNLRGEFLISGSFPTL